MITAIKDSNRELYTNLFAEATDILGGYQKVRTFDASQSTYYYKDSNKDFQPYPFKEETDEKRLEEFANVLANGTNLYIKIEGVSPDKFNAKIGITSLEEYFNWLPDLKERNGKPTKYTILPLDEEHFKIDANTRAINIPNEFKKNGIAVQGDDLAEVVYFKVARYFDAMDLNNTEIYIEWETPKDKTHDAIKGVSDVYIRDIESEPGYLIFGWAISDALTGAAGNLKFSVKFFQSSTDETGKTTLSYALNTLTAQVVIHPSIGIDIENDHYVPDNVNDRLLERIQPSVVVGAVQAEQPRFLENLNPNIEYDIVPDHTNGTYKIYAVATSPDTGAISYVWKRRDLDIRNNKGEAKVEVPNSSATELVPVEVGADGYPLLVEGHSYCYGAYETPWTSGLEGVKNTWTNPTKDNPVPTFYERKAVLTVEKYGAYSVEARNRIFNSMSKVDSAEAMFKRPAFINIDNSNQSAVGHIISEENPVVLEPPFDTTLPGDLSYQWYRGPENHVASEGYKIMNLPVNSQVSYGEKAIRVMIPAETEFYHQNPNEALGGNPNSFYMTVACYVPDGAVSFREGDSGKLDDELLLVSERTTGTDDQGFYRLRWLPVASYDETTKAWTYFGAKSTTEKYIGWDYVVEWYDEVGNLIKADSLRIDLSNEKCHKELADFEIFSDVVDGVDLAQQKSYSPSVPGFYQLVITRTRNRATASEQSLAYRVTHAPQVPQFVTGTYTEATFFSIKELENGQKNLEIVLQDNIDSDEYYVTWNLYRGDKSVPQEDLPIVTYKMTSNSSKFNPADAAYANVFKEAGEDDIEGRYYAVVTNKLNGVTSAPTDIPATNTMFVVTGV